jgi:murein DD-endopeptidase MepM/ murein hydrolase activator NlpD
MGIPSYTRIIFITSGQDHSREYGITRAMVVALLVLVLAGLIVTGVLMVSFAGKYNERQVISELESELVDARAAVQGVNALKEELLYMQGFQEKLLFVLGVQEAPSVPADSLTAWLNAEPGSSAEAMRRSAALSLSPKPDQWPVSGFVTKEFEEGAINRGIRPHQGIDIAGTTDAPILAAGRGRVTRTGTDEFLGNFVEIQHGLGYVTVYGHCSRIAVGRDDRVDVGQIIAYVGQSGQATAPHLHFEVLVQGEAVNPRQILEGDPPTN